MRLLIVVAASLLLTACAEGPPTRGLFDGPRAPTPPAPVLSSQTPPVNPVVGDRSYLEAFGQMPDADTDPELRTSIHLQWAHDWLAANPPADMTAAQARARRDVLDTLQAYIELGAFPRNEAVPGRAPRFVDDEGVHCAVAFLLQQTGERALVADIDARHEYDVVAAFDAPALLPWADAHGMTVDELALIQPTYGWDPPHPEPVRELVHALDEADGTIQWCMNSIGLLITEARVTALLTPQGIEIFVETTPWNATAVRCIENAVRSVGVDAVLSLDGRDSRRVLNRSAPVRPTWRWSTVQALLDGELAPQVDACRLGPLGEGGTWWVDVRVDASGYVSEATASPNDAVGDCLVDVLERVELGAQHAGEHRLELRP